MKVYNMEQKSPEWFEMRYGKIGGSTAEKLTTPAKYKTVKSELLSAKLEPFVYDEDDQIHTKAMDRGNALEPMAREYASEYMGKDYKEFGWLQSDIDVLGLSPDGLTEDYKHSIELKCPGATNHTKYILAGDVIPTEYFWQNVAYFAVNPDLETHTFISYRPECHIEAHIIELNRDTLTVFGTHKKGETTAHGEFKKGDPLQRTVQEWTDILIGLSSDMDEEIKELANRLMSLEAF